MKYYDYAATGPLYPEVREILAKSLLVDFANPNALHALGMNIRDELEEIRVKFLKLIKAKNDDAFYFTSSATESNNTIIKGLTYAPGDIVLYNPADHSSLSAPILEISKIYNIELIELKNNSDGSLDLNFLEMTLKNQSEKIKLIALTSVNNQSGNILEINELSKLIKEHTKAHLHIDAVQHFGKLPLFNLNFVDSFSISAHKIGGPKSIAGLFIKKNIKINPLISGGGQEKGMRSGTESISLIKAFFKASEISSSRINSNIDKMLELKNELKNELEKALPEILAPFLSTSPYIYSFILPGLSSDIIIRHLEMKEIYISTTSACSSRVKGFNPSLMALGIKEEFHKNFLRISFGDQNSKEEALLVAKEIIKIVNDLKKIKR